MPPIVVYILLMRYYPLFLNLEGRRCLVVGAGEVGCRKIRALLDCGAREVLVVDVSSASKAMEELSEAAGLRFEQREFAEKDIEGKTLVIAATSNQAVNRRVQELCERNNILCNVADQPELSSFIVPATVRQGDLNIAVSTSGNSPALAKHIRKKLQDEFGREYAQLSTLMGRLRPLTLDMQLSTAENSTIFRELIQSDLLHAFADSDVDRVRTILKKILPSSLHDNITELLDGLV